MYSFCRMCECMCMCGCVESKSLCSFIKKKKKKKKKKKIRFTCSRVIFERRIMNNVRTNVELLQNKNQMVTSWPSKPEKAREREIEGER